MTEHLSPLTLHYDKNHSPYLALEVQPAVANIYQSFLALHVEPVYIENQVKRDKGGFHITVINVMEFHALRKKGIDCQDSIGTLFDFSVHGIGTACKDTNTAYYAIVECPLAAQLRTQYDLKTHDFHITLGFKEKDVHRTRKDLTTLVWSAQNILAPDKRKLLPSFQP